MPRFQPMLAAKVDLYGEVPADGKLTPSHLSKLRYPLMGSLKIDGIRCLISSSGAVTRKLKPVRNDHARNILNTLPVGLDGELLVTDGKGTFRGTTSGIMSQYGTPNFDYFVFDDYSWPDASFLSSRYQSLIERITTLGPPIKILPQVKINNPEECLAFYTIALAEGLEGIILRDADAPYKFGRSTLKQQWLLKLKPWVDDYAVVIAVIEEEENLNPQKTNNIGYSERSAHKANKRGKGRVGAFRVRHPKLGEFNVGSGMTDEERIEWYTDKMIGRTLKFKYTPASDYDGPRCPIFLGWKDQEP